MSKHHTGTAAPTVPTSRPEHRSVQRSKLIHCQPQNGFAKKKEKKKKGGVRKPKKQSKHDACTHVSSRYAISTHGAAGECKSRYFHIIILACMIQVFKLICSGENKVENVQRRAVPTGGPGGRRRAPLGALSFHPD